MSEHYESPKRARQGGADDDDQLVVLQALLDAERSARGAAEARASYEAQARAAAEARATADALARSAAEANAAIAETARKASEWLFGIVEAGESFAKRIYHGRADQTTRNASSSIGSSNSGSRVPLPGVTEAIQTLVSLRAPDAMFWSTLPLTNAATVDRIVTRLVADPEVQARYAAVAAHRDGGTEIELVHPLAHSVFSIISEELALPGIQLYLEKKSGDDRVPIDKALTRHPDVLFYRHDNAVAEFNSCVQRRGVFAVELKSQMSKRHVDEATVELLRDYAHTVDAGASRTAPTFYALMGDGVKWEASRWRCVVDSYSKAFALERSESFYLDVTDANAARPFVDNIVRLLTSAVASPTHATGWDVAPLDVVGGACITAERVLAATSACVVVQCADATGTTFALKVPRPSQPARCKKEMALRSKWLADGHVPPNIAVCSAMTFFGASAMRLDTVGTLLESVCLCSSIERETVARIVFRDLTAALNWLHTHATAFVDLHPGNVILVGAGAARQAYLIDAESCSALDVRTDAPIHPAFRTLGVDQTPTVTTDRHGLLLILAWVLDVDRFRSGVARFESREARALCGRYASLEAFVSEHLNMELRNDRNSRNDQR